MTNAELAILSLIAEQPRHGYQIEQVIEARQMRNWTEIGFSSIYYLLKKLEKEGLIAGELQPAATQGPPRKVYTITAAGQAQFQTEILATLSAPAPPQDPFQLALANLPAIPPAQALAALQAHLAALQANAEHVTARWQSLGPQAPPHVSAMFDLSSRQITTQIEWLTELIASYQKQHNL